jgi:predicted metalloprotease with PDZ domain
MKFFVKPLGRSRFIEITTHFEAITETETVVQLASWRPGRYEMGNFAKNVRKFRVISESGEPLSYRKQSKDSWCIVNPEMLNFTVAYEYYANELNAGSTYSGADLLFINPINCFIFQAKHMEKACSLEIDIPIGIEIATTLQNHGDYFTAKDVHEMLDSPILCSPNLEKMSFDYDSVTFNLWFYGKNSLNKMVFLDQVKQYTEAQKAVFREFDSSQYNYYFIFLPTRFHHGVEHVDSTVIVMGPGEQFHEPYYHQNLLAISSHELFHYWNIKRIRPQTMLPYDYSRENYSELGFIYEGITTYFGDYLLLKSGVFSFEDYVTQFNADLDKHYENEGRFNYSLAHSSFDTWLDGYVPGVPGRKVSIYTEGLLASLILDVELRKASNNGFSLADVMYLMYSEIYKRNKGYTFDDFISLCQRGANKNIGRLVHELVFEIGHISTYLEERLNYFGLTLEAKESEFTHEQKYGFKISNGSVPVISVVVGNSPAEQAGLCVNDALLLVNNAPVDNGADWNQAFLTGGEIMAWNAIEGNKAVLLRNDGTSYFESKHLIKIKNCNANQKLNFEIWSGQSF